MYGIILNVILVVTLILAGTHKNFIMKIAIPIINFVSKIHIGKVQLIKNKEERIEKFDASVTNFSEQFTKMRKEKKIIWMMMVIGLVQSILYYAITYTVYRTFGNYGNTFLEIITTQAFLMLIMTVFPTPGAGLGAEGGFLLLFNSIFQNGTINLSILFWRIYIFYVPLIAGAIFYIYTMKKLSKK